MSMQDRPLASQGWISYRCRSPYGWIMIGAKDHDDAMREARRSNPTVSRDGLQVWDASARQYVAA